MQNYAPRPNMTNPYPPPPRRAAPWALLVALDVLVSLFTLVVFGAFGGLFMLIALNGFSGREGGIILTVYAAVVLLGNVVGAALLNWLVLRGRRAPGARVSKAAVVVPAVAVTTVLLLVGPPLSVFLIKLIF